MDVASLEPRLTDGPIGSIDSRRAEDVGCANPPIRCAVQHVRLEIDIVHLVAGREAEADTSRLPRAIVCTLDNI